jgi:integrase
LRNRLKTESRKRSIPLIGRALEAARDQVEHSKGRGDGKLFKGYSEKHGANALSAQLSKALRAAGVPKSKRLTVYSFRHTLIEAMRQAGVSSDLRRMIVGHSAKDSHDRYGAPAALLSDMRDALLRAVPKLGDVDESIYTVEELL